MSAKVFKGKVVSTKMRNTVVVAVEMPHRHKLYDKIIKKTRRFKAHDVSGVKVGDEVTIRESKPYSKQVNFEVVVEKKGKGTK